MKSDSEPHDPTGAQPRTLVYSFLAAFLIVLFLNFLVFRHFLVTATVSASVAALLGPIYDRLTRLLWGSRSVSAGLLVALTIVVILVPLSSYVVLLGNQAVGLFEWIRPQLEPEALRRLWTETLPARYPWVETIKESLRLNELDLQRAMEIVSPVLSRLASGTNRLVQGAITGVTTALFELILFLILLFFILRDGKVLGRELLRVAPVSRQQALEIYDHLTRTVKGVLYSMVVVPVAQGLLAMVGFAIFGLPSPVFWGTMLIFAAIIPGIGSPLVWVPSGVYLLFTAPLWQGVGLLLYGTLIISTSDNVIKPILLKETARIHPMLAFLAILGGIFSFGPIGFLVGPVILSLLLSALRIYGMDILQVTPSEPSAPAAQERGA